MRVLLVTMPWQGLDCPSLPLGILRKRAKACREAHEILDCNGHLRWAEFLFERTGGRIGPVEYTRIANEGIFQGVGDWIFTSALYGTAEWRRAGFEDYLARQGRELGPGVEMHQLAPAFIEQLADELVALGCEVVGFSSTFMQNVPSLALARALKQRRPGLLTVLGGSNCDGPQGAALHRNYDFLDFVVRGEGEQAFVELLDALGGHGSLASIEGLCWRTEQGPVANPDRVHTFPVGQIPTPDFDSYFSALERSPIRGFIEPKLVLEGARGCWWGEKHHCTFCGLNGSTMKFRSKAPAAFWDELRAAVERYKTLDLFVVDNIIDLRYFKELLPHVAAADWDMRIHYEVKSNLTVEQIRALREARVVHVQPGIENLSSRVLKLMDKGVGGCHNIQVLRDCEEHGLTTSWNYLYGFPGETEEDYLGLIAQFPALVHLQPPTAAAPIALERFSPNFERPSLGFPVRRPAEFYPYIYELPESELMDMVFLFDTVKVGICGTEAERRLTRAAAAWRDYYPTSELSYRDDGRRIRIRDARANRSPAEYVLESRMEVLLHRNLRRPQSVQWLQGLLERSGVDATEEEVAAQLAAWKGLGLVFEEGGRFVALALHDNRRRVRSLPPDEEESFDGAHNPAIPPAAAGQHPAG